MYQVKLCRGQNINTSRGFSALASTNGAFGNTGRASDSLAGVTEKLNGVTDGGRRKLNGVTDGGRRKLNGITDGGRRKLNGVTDGGRRKLNGVTDGAPEKGRRCHTFTHTERALVATFNFSDLMH